MIEQWINAIKDICILVDLNQDFIQGKLIGRGNYGSVNASKRINDPDTTYAVKSLKKNDLRNKRTITDVINEIEILRRLDHSHVIKLYWVYEDPLYMHLVL